MRTRLIAASEIHGSGGKSDPIDALAVARAALREPRPARGPIGRLRTGVEAAG